MSDMRVVVYAHDSRLGSGAVHMLQELLVRRPDAVRVLVVFPEPGDAVDAAADTGAETIVLPHYWRCAQEILSPPGRFRWAIRAKRRFLRWEQHVPGNLRELRRHVREISGWKPDAVYTNTSVIAMGKRVARRLGLPHILHVHEYGEPDHALYGLRFAMTRSGLCRNSRVIANSESTRQYIIAKTRGCDPVVVLNGIALRPVPARKRRACDEGARLLMVGRVAENKGQFEAVHALNRLRRSGVDARLDVVGQGATDALADLCSKYGLESHVRIVGPVREVDGHYAQADVFLMCSPHEAFGLCTAEAMMHGLPVIGRVGPDCATNELVVDRETGLHYRGGARELADAVIEMLSDRSRMCEWGANGRRRAESLFHADRYAADVWACITGEIRKARARGAAGNRPSRAGAVSAGAHPS